MNAAGEQAREEVIQELRLLYPVHSQDRETMGLRNRYTVRVRDSPASTRERRGESAQNVQPKQRPNKET
jgi:SRSO17 transposase